MVLWICSFLPCYCRFLLIVAHGICNYTSTTYGCFIIDVNNRCVWAYCVCIHSKFSSDFALKGEWYQAHAYGMSMNKAFKLNLLFLYNFVSLIDFIATFSRSNCLFLFYTVLSFKCWSNRYFICNGKYNYIVSTVRISIFLNPLFLAWRAQSTIRFLLVTFSGKHQ